LRVCNRKQRERSEAKRYSVLMTCVHWFEPHRHRQIQFDAIAALPLAIDGHESSWNHFCAQTATVDRNRSSFCPRRNSKIQIEITNLRGFQLEAHRAFEGIVAFLSQRYLRAILLPSQCGWNVQVHPDAARITEVGVDAIIRRYLGQRARTAGPLLIVFVNLASLE